MHARSATATMAFPSLPASPTLTNPDMILPYGEYDSTPSPTLNAYDPEEDDDSWGRNSKEMQFSIGPSHSGPMTPTTPIIYGNGTMLSDIGEVTEVESTPKRKLPKFPNPAERRMLKQQAHAATVQSSPTLGYPPAPTTRKTGTHERKVSIESTSTITSEAHTAELFKDFDDSVSVDDSVFQGDDEESVADSYAEEMIEAETQRLSRRKEDFGQREDQYSSAASRRAEQILLNAKKRLNNMEGNLTQARSSFYITPSSSLSSIHNSSPLTKPASLDLTSAKHLQLNTPVDSPAGPGHTRVFSENSITPSFRNAQSPVRSASAAARYIGKSGTDSSLSPGHSPENTRALPSPKIRLDPLSEHAIVPDFDGQASGRSSLDEYSDFGGEHRGLTRSTSTMQMRDLRDQMHDLKGRLSVLRDRARDDNMKRRSMQSLRTPSPFTAAEQYYNGSKNYGNESLSANARVSSSQGDEAGFISEDKPRSPSRALDFVEDGAMATPGYAASDATSIYEDVSEGYRASSELDMDEPSEFDDDSESTSGEELMQEIADDKIPNDYNDEIIKPDELDEYDSDASLYHDTLTAPLSHEDREDAFDYEHFFLHSAMGTLSQQRGRRDSAGSYGSEDSVETTRGPAAPSSVNERRSIQHLRSPSTDTVSTMATFATALESPGSEDEDKMSSSTVHAVAPPLRSTTPVTAKRSTFGSPGKFGSSIDRQDGASRSTSATRNPNERNSRGTNRPSIASFDSFGSTGTSRSFPLVNKPKPRNFSTPTTNSRQSNSVLSDSPTLTECNGLGERLQASPVHMLGKDDQLLVEKLVASLGKCVLGLQEAGKGSYDSTGWRRRLDSARRILEGEEGSM